MGEALVSVIKFFLALVLAPFVWATLVSFQNHSQAYPSASFESLALGAGIFLIIFLFVFQFWRTFEFGQSIIKTLVTFTAPFERIVAYCIPFYFIVVGLICLVVNQFMKTTHYNPVFMFLLGFVGAMHIVLAAQELQQTEESIIRPSYLFWMMIIIPINILFYVLLLDACFGKMEIGAFVQSTLSEAQSTYMLVYKTWFR